jgi:hypothetical protein
VFAGTHAYYAGSAGTEQGPTLYAVDLDSGTVTPLGSVGVEIGVLAHADGALYWSEPSADSGAPYIDRLMRMPTSGGEPEEVEVDLGSLRLAFQVIDAAADAVFLDVSLVLGQDYSDDSSVTAAGIYRQPSAGGRALQLLETSAFSLFDFASAPQVVQGEDALFLRTGTLQSSSVFTLAIGESEPEKTFCVKLEQELVAAMAVADGSVYLALSLDDESLIVRRDL